MGFLNIGLASGDGVTLNQWILENNSGHCLLHAYLRQAELLQRLDCSD